MDAVTRYCEDCAHCVLAEKTPSDPSGLRYATCSMVLRTGTVHLISRQFAVAQSFCEAQRHTTAKCGPTGKLFEAKP